MFRYRIGLIFLMVLGFWMNQASAQTNSSPINVKFSPQHLLINGLHLDIEKPDKQNIRRSFIFSPRFYSGRTRTVDFISGRHQEEEDNAQVLGYGAELQQRWYVSKNTDVTKERTYVAYGLNLHHFAVDFEKEAWVEEIGSDGLYYYRYKMQPHREKINQWGAVAMFGAQSPLIGPNTIWDIFLGVGYHNSISQSNYNTIRYNESFLDYGYTGLYFLAGIKLGVVL